MRKDLEESWVESLAAQGISLVLDYFDGKCPVQAEGTVQGCHFYFRARNGAWTMDIVRPGGDPIWPVTGGVWCDSGEDPSFGYAEPEDIKDVLEECFIRFAIQQDLRFHLVNLLSRRPTEEYLQEVHDIHDEVLFL